MQRTASATSPPADLLFGKVPSDSGSLLVGSNGSIFSPSDYGSEQVLIGADRSEASKPETTSKKGDRPKTPNPDELHKDDWVRAIKENDPKIAWSNFGYSGVLTEAMLLGNVAVRLGKSLDFDAPSGSVTNCPDASPLIRPSFRKGSNCNDRINSRASRRRVRGHGGCHRVPGRRFGGPEVRRVRASEGRVPSPAGSPSAP